MFKVMIFKAKKMKKILITGSAGYIGSCLLTVLKKKYDIYGIDKSYKKKYANKEYKASLLNYNYSRKIIKDINPDLIIHLAGESTIDGIEKKNEYIKNNIKVTKNLLKIMQDCNIDKIIFSSTAAVYRANNSLKNFAETSKLGPNNIYGKTKLNCEKMIKKKIKNYIIFRFFNVCSALPWLNKGELHQPETHLIPLAVYKIKKKKNILIYGNNFKTKDGTCIRDYIHIFDLCQAFSNGLKKIFNKKIKKIINLGSEKPYTNLEIVKKIYKILKVKEKKIFFSKRRKGDISRLVCSSKKAKKIINWKPKYSNLNKILSDEIKWQNKIKKKKIFLY
jgi:UDP-glucose 4-epimerase